MSSSIQFSEQTYFCVKLDLLHTSYIDDTFIELVK